MRHKVSQSLIDPLQLENFQSSLNRLQLALGPLRFAIVSGTGALPGHAGGGGVPAVTFIAAFARVCVAFWERRDSRAVLSPPRAVDVFMAERLHCG